MEAYLDEAREGLNGFKVKNSPGAPASPDPAVQPNIHVTSSYAIGEMRLHCRLVLALVSCLYPDGLLRVYACENTKNPQHDDFDDMNMAKQANLRLWVG